MSCHAGSNEKFIPIPGEKQGEAVERLFLSWFPLPQGQTHPLVPLNVQMICCAGAARQREGCAEATQMSFALWRATGMQKGRKLTEQCWY